MAFLFIETYYTQNIAHGISLKSQLLGVNKNEKVKSSEFWSLNTSCWWMKWYWNPYIKKTWDF